MDSCVFFFKFVTVIVAKFKLKNANLKVKWPSALYDFDKTRSLSKAIHSNNNEPQMISDIYLSLV